MLQTRVDPSPLFELPAEMPPLQDLTSYQLVLVLEEQCGFTWRKMPGKKEREVIAFVPALEDCPRHWCSGKAKPNHAYLRALAAAATMPQAKIEKVMHGENHSYYLELLGLQPKRSNAPMALDNDEGEFPAPKRRRQDQLALDDGEVDVEAIQDKVDAADLEFDFDALEQALEAELTGANLQESVANLEEPSDGEGEAGDDEDVKEIMANDPAAVNHRWGAFHFTLKYNPKIDTFSWQCACPFHRLSRGTGCKKTYRLDRDVPFDDASKQVLFRLRHWANQARNYSRQRFHRRLDVLPNDCPPQLVIEAQRLDEVPDRSTVKMDGELDGDPESDGEAEEGTEADVQAHLGDAIFLQACKY